MWDTWVLSLGWEGAPEEEMATTSALLPGEFHGQRSLVAYGQARKESDTTERLTLSLLGFFQARNCPWSMKTRTANMFSIQSLCGFEKCFANFMGGVSHLTFVFRTTRLISQAPSQVSWFSVLCYTPWPHIQIYRLIQLEFCVLILLKAFDWSALYFTIILE